MIYNRIMLPEKMYWFRMKLQSLLQRQNERDESDLPWFKLNFCDCPIPVFSFFCNILHERKGCIRHFFVFSSCNLHSSTCHNYCDCSILSSVQSSTAFTLVAFKMNWSIARCLLLRMMKKGWVGGKQGYLLLTYYLIIFCVGRKACLHLIDFNTHTCN